MSLTTSPVPKYHQLAQVLHQKIMSGELKPHAQFPTETALCQQYSVSRGTVQQAIRTLVQKGLIRREQGRGTFVNPLPIRDSIFFTLTSFDEDMRRQNRRPSTRLVTAEVIPATPEIAAQLKINVDDSVIHIARLRLANDQPVVYETRCLAYTFCPRLLEDDLEEESIHRLLIDKYQIPLVRMTCAVEARILSGQQAELLQALPETAAFFVDRLTFTTHLSQQVPAVWFQAIYREDNYNWHGKRVRYKQKL
jgi:GntR family transcriptional regulator